MANIFKKQKWLFFSAQIVFNTQDYSKYYGNTSVYTYSILRYSTCSQDLAWKNCQEAMYKCPSWKSICSEWQKLIPMKAKNVKIKNESNFKNFHLHEYSGQETLHLNLFFQHEG